MPDPTRDGLVWESCGSGLLDSEPRWPRQPSVDAIEDVCRLQLGVDDDSDCFVSLHSAGAYNKLYLVECPGKGRRFMMRVSLPVEPRYKTRGEVTTLQLIRRKTDVPVPKVVAFDDSSKNGIGFEWILMELMPGKSAHYRWRKMPMAAKETLVARVADFQAQLFRCGGRLDCDGNRVSGFRGIGTLYTNNRHSDPEATPEPGRIVSSVFFAGDHFHYDVPRGPFPSSHEWLRAYLNIIVKEHKTAIAEATDEEDRLYAEAVLRVARKLQRLLHKIFPSVVNPPERTVLWHDDLSLMNILVDDQGRITAVLDWECVSTMPLWVASQMPEFLRGTTREEMPDRSQYGDVSDQGSDASEFGNSCLEESLDNEGKSELYWIHLMEYEQTQLRKVYHARMRQLRPEWDLEVAEGALKADFLGAVARCGAGFYLKRIEQWVDAIMRREYCRLTDVLRVGLR
ncbi:phosphotransferase enzyme family-domain-containing protein [Diplogelasinospora grovesii]|uniref:Phosphotransferase enzyme family-domain-containing protein n=1 Tax=Diplogelasinospora grovesii TaxID=303347 RepID=A0AAN6S2P4_9PEZI|nr:phosphotransferase enzyme family-domain-containing protein [Diplogelasinospora grovesii]